MVVVGGGGTSQQLGVSFTLQHGNSPKATAKTLMVWLQDTYLNILECTDFNLIENL